jgi:hypothetical protein
VSDVVSVSIEEGENEESDEEDTKPGKLSENDETGWLLGRTSKTVKWRIEIFEQR